MLSDCQRVFSKSTITPPIMHICLVYFPIPLVRAGFNPDSSKKGCSRYSGTQHEMGQTHPEKMSREECSPSRAILHAPWRPWPEAAVPVLSCTVDPAVPPAAASECRSHTQHSNRTPLVTGSSAAMFTRSLHLPVSSASSSLGRTHHSAPKERGAQSSRRVLRAQEKGGGSKDRPQLLASAVNSKSSAHAQAAGLTRGYAVGTKHRLPQKT